MRWTCDLTGAEPIIKDIPVYNTAGLSRGALLMLSAATGAGAGCGIAGISAYASTEANGALDAIGMGSMGASVTPLIGGYAMKDEKDRYRAALVKLDSGLRSLDPLAKRFRDGRVDDSYFKNERAVVLLTDIIKFNYDLLIELLAERKGKESVWFILKELTRKIKELFGLISEE